MPEITTKFVFFGCSHEHFNQSSDIAADMTDEEAARIITDHFLRSSTRWPRHTKASAAKRRNAFAFVTVLRLLFFYVAAAQHRCFMCASPCWHTIFTQFLVELVLRHGVVFYNLHSDAGRGLDNRNADGLACFRQLAHTAANLSRSRPDLLLPERPSAWAKPSFTGKLTVNSGLASISSFGITALAHHNGEGRLSPLKAELPPAQSSLCSACRRQQ